LKKIEKNFHAQGIRPSEYVEPNTFSPFNPRVEEKSIGEKFYFIYEKFYFMHAELFSMHAELFSMHEKFYSMHAKLFSIDAELFSIYEKFYFIYARGRAFIAEWEKKSITYPWQGAEVQAVNINLRSA
jgi:hypothetical protein